MLKFRKARLSDVDQFFLWANEEGVRQNSFSQDPIPYDTHVAWFKRALANPDVFFYLFESEDGKAAGQVRIEKKPDEIVIGISIDSGFRGKGLGKEMITVASKDFIHNFPGNTIVAYIKPENLPSLKAFKSAGYSGQVEADCNGHICYRLIYSENNV
jgi:RimJ/RimL family protein N-acetyltransferase